MIFKSETDPDMNWDFEPVNEEMTVNAGETALTFYKALNHNTEPIIGNYFIYFRICYILNIPWRCFVIF